MRVTLLVTACNLFSVVSLVTGSKQLDDSISGVIRQLKTEKNYTDEAPTDGFQSRSHTDQYGQDGELLESRMVKVPQLNISRSIRDLNWRLQKPVSLYNEETDFVTIVSGSQQFDEIIYQDQLKHINIVQFYMATCPDCQGFAPYFKMFSKDIKRWNNMIKVHTVNCNDDKNTQLCRDHNPNILVPTVRWYSFGKIMRVYKDQFLTMSLDGITPLAMQQQEDQIKRPTLTVSHRDWKEAHRDPTSLRHRTIDFINMIIDEIKLADDHRNQLSTIIAINELSNEWRLLLKINDKSSIDEYFKFISHVIDSYPYSTCTSDIKGPTQSELEFKLFERDSLITLADKISSSPFHLIIVVDDDLKHEMDAYVGSTIALDWSDYYACSRRLKITHSNNQKLSQQLVDMSSTNGQFFPTHFQYPALFHLQFNNKTLSPLSCKLLDHKGTLRHGLSRRSPWIPSSNGKRQLASITSSNSINDYEYSETIENANSPFKLSKKSSSRRLRRSINWNPGLYPDEEWLRYNFNKKILHSVLSEIPAIKLSERLDLSKPTKDTTTPAPVLLQNEGDDKNPLLLTDYYKILYFILEKDIWRKKFLDGYQALTAIRFIEDLKQFFPFEVPSNKRTSSKVYRYIDSMQALLVKELMKAIYKSAYQHNMDSVDSRIHKEFIIFGSRTRLGTHQLYNEFMQQVQLDSIKLDSKHLEQQLFELQNEHGISLENAGNFDWKYCSGSSSTYRGYTCGLWILFHTMLSEEHNYLENLLNRSSHHIHTRSVVNSSHVSQIDFCKTDTPESDLLAMNSQEKFVDNRSVLATIVNYVRYFFNCDNCAGHFSCMVRDSLASGKLKLLERSSDEETLLETSIDHNLWLWEAHNRVNARTKGTHSEDPEHPKKIVPSYEICPECYLRRPSDPTGIESLDLFNLENHGDKIYNFLDSRYKRESIVHNNINIEKKLNLNGERKNQSLYSIDHSASQNKVSKTDLSENTKFKTMATNKNGTMQTIFKQSPMLSVTDEPAAKSSATTLIMWRVMSVDLIMMLVSSVISLFVLGKSFTSI